MDGGRNDSGLKITAQRKNLYNEHAEYQLEFDAEYEVDSVVANRVTIARVNANQMMFKSATFVNSKYHRRGNSRSRGHQSKGKQYNDVNNDGPSAMSLAYLGNAPVNLEKTAKQDKTESRHNKQNSGNTENPKGENIPSGKEGFRFIKTEIKMHENTSAYLDSNESENHIKDTKCEHTTQRQSLIEPRDYMENNNQCQNEDNAMTDDKTYGVTLTLKFNSKHSAKIDREANADDKGKKDDGNVCKTFQKCDKDVGINGEQSAYGINQNESQARKEKRTKHSNWASNNNNWEYAYKNEVKVKKEAMDSNNGRKESDKKLANTMMNRTNIYEESNENDSTKKASTNTKLGLLAENKIQPEIVKPKVKVAHMYVVISKKLIRQDSDSIRDFLLHRMGNHNNLDFDIVKTHEEDINNTVNGVITVRFNSFTNASTARQLLNISNRNAAEKVFYFSTKEDALRHSFCIADKKQSELDKVEKEIAERIEAVMADHEDKIKELRNKVEASSNYPRNKGVLDGEHDKLSKEKLALDDKLKELSLQKLEFTRYVDSIKSSLKEVVFEGVYENKLKDIRMKLGIECRRFATALPLYARRNDILTLVKKNQVCVILGETGSGKSTQMVQYLYQAGFAENGLIACTQPRKIAAISLAKQVSVEMSSSVGHLIGYKVGMQTKSSTETKVIFMTDHILLNECLHDRRLTKYSCILIDEAHERSIHTDLLLGMIKEAIIRRPDIKIIITSATIDPDIFVAYFGGKDSCPVLKVSGRMFPVEVFWESNSRYDSPFPEDYETKALNKAVEINQSTADGDILVFLASPVEIERCVVAINKRCGELKVWCLPLHGRLKPEEQQLVFQPAPNGKRKIVFATNSAETSITIPGIKFVVDTGVVKEMRFDPRKNINCLDVVAISQSSANQRKGRAGRISSGKCYRLYSEANYKLMDKTSTPEILRIQVAHALLKLLELGADPMKFHYVQSPNRESMNLAMQELSDLGAIKQSTITDLGKWIAKLPVEPRLGILIKRGCDLDIAIESLVIAACCNQSGIFFRAGTQEEKKAADLKKMKFCNLSGDLLTMLNVYREWDQIQENAKGRWCKDNSINGKAMKGVREMVNEVSTIMKKEMDLQIKQEFRKPEDADPLLQNIVFECMSANLGFYLGHEEAGYLIMNRKQRVHLHPSSALLSLGFNPCWVVFNRVLRTSEDFLLEVTPVPDNLIKEALNNKGKVAICIRELEEAKVICALKKPVGKHVFENFVGPIHRNRRKVEKDIGQQCDGSMIFIKANKHRREICLYSQPKFAKAASALLSSTLDKLSEQLLNESREEKIAGSEIRAVLQEGGAAVDILLPDQIRSFSIHKKESIHYDLDEETTRKKLESFGPVGEIWISSGGNRYKGQFIGKVTFTHEVDAASAAKHFDNDKDGEIRLIPIRFGGQRCTAQHDCSIKMTWCRRPIKGYCFVQAYRAEDSFHLLWQCINIKGKSHMFSKSKKKSDLYLDGLQPNVNEEDVRNALGNKLGISERMCLERFKIVIPRAHVNEAIARNEQQRIKEKLAAIVGTYASCDRFNIRVCDIRPKDAIYSAFAMFEDPRLCHSTGQKMINKAIEFDGHEMKVSTEYKSAVHVNRRLFDLVRADVKEMSETHNQNTSTSIIKIRQLKSKHTSIDIKAQSPEELAEDKLKVEKVLNGEELECGDKDNLYVMFTKEGRQKAQQIEKISRTLIFVNENEMKVSIQGLKRNRESALRMVTDYISNHQDSIQIEIPLIGDRNPPGLTQTLISKYGFKLEGLKSATRVSDLRLNLRSHYIIVSGHEKDVMKIVNIIKELQKELSKRIIVTALESGLPQCTVCQSVIEYNDIRRLEYCGHSYCKVCLSTLVQQAVSKRTLPIVCASKSCGKPLVIRDINFQMKMGNLKRKDLLNAAISCLVMTQFNRFRFCVTPKCISVYRTTSNGEKFTCPLCYELVCTACHIPYHDGLTCAKYHEQKNRSSVQYWAWAWD